MTFTDFFITYKQPLKTLLWAAAGVIIATPTLNRFPFAYFSYFLLILSFLMVILAISQFIKINQSQKKS